MNLLILIKLAVVTCFAVISDNQDSYGAFEGALNSVENNIVIESVDFYRAPLVPGSIVVDGDVYTLNGVVFTCK